MDSLPGKKLEDGPFSISFVLPRVLSMHHDATNCPQGGSGWQDHRVPATPPSQPASPKTLCPHWLRPRGVPPEGFPFRPVPSNNLAAIQRTLQAIHLVIHIQKYLCSPCNRRPGEVLGTSTFIVLSTRQMTEWARWIELFPFWAQFFYLLWQSDRALWGLQIVNLQTLFTATFSWLCFQKELTHLGVVF